MCQQCIKIFEKFKNEILSEISELLEMLENLRISFKIGHDMNIEEEKTYVSTEELVNSIG